MTSPLAVGAALLLVSSQALAAPRPVVIELFTSEGCSSCPPADALLTSLSDRRDLLPLAFHVDYWNALGWRDPFSLAAATRRQAAYAERLGGGSYTPEMVVDGRRGMVGSEAGQVAAAIAAAARATPLAVPLKTTRAGASLSISIGPGTGRGQILLVGFDPRHETHVGRGENRGRTLIESNVVRSIRSVGTYSGDALSLTVPAGAGVAAAVIVQAADGSILAAGRL